ncbi:MAG TPA: hypothetical protein DD648_05145 [Candidatus Omnitrophica bacterium]|nr:hypothetical protein [Candidatus Omnitrophota bacterium]
MKKHDDRPATKGDLDRFATKADLDRFATKIELKEEIAGLRTELNLEIAETRRTLAIEIVKTNARIDSVKDQLMEELSQIKSHVSGVLDRAVSRMETLWRESVTLPKEIDRHAAILGDHAVRIKALEARPG